MEAQGAVFRCEEARPATGAVKFRGAAEEGGAGDRVDESSCPSLVKKRAGERPLRAMLERYSLLFRRKQVAPQPLPEFLRILLKKPRSMLLACIM